MVRKWNATHLKSKKIFINSCNRWNQKTDWTRVEKNNKEPGSGEQGYRMLACTHSLRLMQVTYAYHLATPQGMSHDALWTLEIVYHAFLWDGLHKLFKCKQMDQTYFYYLSFFRDFDTHSYNESTRKLIGPWAEYCSPNLFLKSL